MAYPAPLSAWHMIPEQMSSKQQEFSKSFSSFTGRCATWSYLTLLLPHLNIKIGLGRASLCSRGLLLLLLASLKVGDRVLPR